MLVSVKGFCDYLGSNGQTAIDDHDVCDCLPTVMLLNSRPNQYPSSGVGGHTCHHYDSESFYRGICIGRLTAIQCKCPCRIVQGVLHAP